MRIHPFRPFRPPAELAAKVASVPYDVIDSAGARGLAAGNPCSFLHVVRPEIDLPEEISLHDDRVYEKARENFDAFIADGTLVRDAEPGLFVYRLTMGAHRQSGIVATCHVDEYARDIIKKHERTLPSKEDDRTRHVATLNANAGPVFLTYADTGTVDVEVARIEFGPPEVDFVAPDGIRHEIWRAEDPATLVDAFAGISSAYVADGHHRSASAARVGLARRENNPHHTGEEPYNWFLSVLFPASQLQVLAYNRVVHDLNGQTVESFLGEVRSRFEVEEGADPIPDAPCRVRMYLDGRWFGLSWKPDPAAGPVASLDVSVLQDRLLKPVLGIGDPRTSARIHFVGGIHGAAGLERCVDAGEGSVAFSLYPTRMEQLMAIADAGQIMPPKSTWFEPKLRSGLFVHSLD